jgi:hypothetical protein
LTRLTKKDKTKAATASNNPKEKASLTQAVSAVDSSAAPGLAIPARWFCWPAVIIVTNKAVPIAPDTCINVLAIAVPW